MMRKKDEKVFSFGENWRHYLSYLTESRILSASNSLTDFMMVDSLSGKSFLDIGCGSGLFSYAAWRLGADRVTSIDRDPLAVECCKYLKKKANNPSKWEIVQGSILDQGFVSGLKAHDIVYSWGVLHHTGNMWKAVATSARLVDDGGLFYIALYNRVKGLFGSRAWLEIKRTYNSSPRFGKSLLESVYVAALAAGFAVKSRSLVKGVESSASRGMYWRTDAIDWLGGYPYEYASGDEVNSFMRRNFPRFALIKYKYTKGLGNNSFLYRNL